MMEERMKDFPDVPTLTELGYPCAGATLMSIVGPKGIPEDRAKKIHDAFKKAMDDPAFTKVMTDVNCNIRYRGPQELGKYIEKIYNDHADVKKILGLEK